MPEREWKAAECIQIILGNNGNKYLTLIRSGASRGGGSRGVRTRWEDIELNSGSVVKVDKRFNIVIVIKL